MVVLDREAILDRVARGLSTADDAAALRAMLGPQSRKSGALPVSRLCTVTDDQVREMRAEWAQWCAAGVAGQRGAHPRGYGSLAVIFGVNAATARDIVTGRTRRSAGGPIDDQRAARTRPCASRRQRVLS
jgi:hypothetical protein